MSFRDVAGPTVACPGCQAQVPTGTRLCPACGEPVDLDQHAELVLKLQPDLRKARLFLGIITVLGALEIAFRTMMYARGPSIGELAFVSFFGVCFLVARRWPLGASIAAMSLFLFGQAQAAGAGSLGLLLAGLPI